ncbi:245_t:CDS:2 [Funneliformis caledonium]|uniref:245_t:CDS:1 n=1 Tax=Funneliformis caledonium TaxID=1117310 RepID=A0A9N9IQ01_9GLOM|nr:245_t:CDS:2 [Funneliformis caledonium]
MEDISMKEHCEECNKSNIDYDWCQTCNAKSFNEMKIGLKICMSRLAKGGFKEIFKAKWKDGFIDKWDTIKNQWKRYLNEAVALKFLRNSQDITDEF